jgi:hypothetical protein
MANVYTPNVIFPPTGGIISGLSTSALLLNNTNPSTTTQNAGATNPIPNLAGSTAASGSSTVLVAAFNNSNSTFTAPVTGVYMFDLAVTFTSGSPTANYQTYFYTNAMGGSYLSYKIAAFTGYSLGVNGCTLKMTKGQTVQFYAYSSIAWGNYASTLNIVLIPS